MIDPRIEQSIKLLENTYLKMIEDIDTEKINQY